MDYRLPSERYTESDRHRAHTYMVTVFACRDCGETFDALPRVRGEVACPCCGADEDHIVKRRIRD
jgi:hypothetical protein